MGLKPPPEDYETDWISAVWFWLCVALIIAAALAGISYILGIIVGDGA